MKNLIYSLAFLLIGSFAFANKNSAETIIPKLSKFQLANLEVSNLDTEVISNYLFKKNNCETGGFSFFSPFHEVAGLANSRFNSYVDKDGNVNIEVNYNDKKNIIKLTNLSISEDGTQAFVDVETNNTIFKSSFMGENLNIDFIKNKFASINSSFITEDACPPCIYIAIVVISAAVTKICTDASSACNPCNGKLTVSACSCSCEPK
jgi:hypothetical protein